MRIISGEVGGRQIKAPKGLDTRPTLDRVKESLFSIIRLKLPEANVLDLYAGSGALGLEALSRGAAYTVFNDVSRMCCALIRENLDKLGYSDRSTVLNMSDISALTRLRGQSTFDLVFLDPPYSMGAEKALHRIFEDGLLSADGIVVVEHDIKKPPSCVQGLMRCTDMRKYGATCLSFFTGGL